eukprot:7057669-Pyramimonas_sp.AAC.1
MMPRGIEVIREVRGRTESQRAGDPSYSNGGRMEDESEEEEKGEEGGRRKRNRRMKRRMRRVRRRKMKERASRMARGLLDASRSLSKCLLGASWTRLGTFWGPHGGPRGLLE